MQDKVFYTMCFGFVFGVLLRSFVVIDIHLTILFSIITLAILLFFTLISKHKWGIIISTFIFVFCLGILRFHIIDVPALQFFESQVGQKVSFSGEIIDEPSIGENNQKLTVEVHIKETNPTSLKLRGAKAKILLSTSLDADYKYGDEINFSGKLEKPENFITDQGKEFDYIHYLRKDGIFYVMSYPKIQIISRGNGSFIKSTLFFVKEKFLEKVNLAVPAPESLLMGGLILGEKSSFSQELRTDFINTGTIHIVALSGYNITIVADWIMRLFSYFPRSFGIGAGILAIFLFVVMTGASSTAIRAGIMAILVLIARATGRTYDVARALALAGVLMIFFNPFILAYDVSFQLSFIATVAIIFFSPKVERHLSFIPKNFQLRDIISSTCAAYIFVLPFILYKMGNLSFVALPANVLILPFIIFTMLLGFLTGFAGLIWHALAVPLGYISYLFLHYELSVINFFAKIPFAALTIPDFPLILTLLIYAYFIYMLFWKKIKKSSETEIFAGTDFSKLEKS